MKLLKWIIDKIVLWRWNQYCDSFAKKGGSDEQTLKLYFKWSQLHRFSQRLDRERK